MMRDEDMNYEGWLGSVPTDITGDPLWRAEAYRLALFVGELGWHDVTKLIRDKRTTELADQRSATFREDSPVYHVNNDPIDQQPLDRAELNALLQNSPLP